MNTDNTQPSSFFLSGARNATLLLLLILSALAINGCQPIPLEVQHFTAKTIDLAKYKTFAIEPAIEEDNFLIAHVSRGIAKNLTDKGYQLAEQPELLVRYQVKLIQDKKVNVIDRLEDRKIDTNHRGKVFRTQIILEPVYEAKMLINAIDVNTNEVVWKASTASDLMLINTEPVDQQQINQSIAELFASFPRRR